jgi:hypothetical protein
LLYVDVCGISLVRQALLKGFKDMEITWREIGTVGWDMAT